MKKTYKTKRNKLLHTQQLADIGVNASYSLNKRIGQKLRSCTFMLALLSIIGTFALSCKDENAIIENNKSVTIPLTHLQIPIVYNISNDTDIQILGKGFIEGDEIQFVPHTGGDIKIIPVKAIEDQKIILSSAGLLMEGRYDVYVLRGTVRQMIGRTFINQVFNVNLPDKAGMNIKGTVYSNGKGIANIVVSDGVEITKTDENGVYYLASFKKTGYVFISQPANYEVKIVNAVPQFFKNLAGLTAEAEIKDFELTAVNNDNHAIVFLADMHLANRNDDLAQFTRGFMTDVKATAAEMREQNKRFYALTLGDQSWDAYWYENNFGLREYVKQIQELDFPIYNTIGNHDNDPYFTNDWLSESKYRNILGPTYYSFNLGKIHYVVLDNVVYKNIGGANGMMGDRSYEATITNEQIEWLKKDLALVEDKSAPLVVAMHVPLYNNPTLGAATYSLKNASTLLNVLQSFSNVKVLSGHTHINYRVKQESSNVEETNVAAVSATWWWTGKSGYAGNHISRDGSPGGYAVWENTGKDQKSYYKSTGQPKNYQFRSYDMNTVQITAATHTPNAEAEFKAKVPSIAGEYATKTSNNEVMINVWGYKKNWKITVTEAGTNLPVTQVYKKDPLHIISYATQRLNVNADPTSSFMSVNTTHLFSAKASKANTTLEIIVEDEFGNMYKETMTRPKAFNYAIQ